MHGYIYKAMNGRAAVRGRSCRGRLKMFVKGRDKENGARHREAKRMEHETR